MNRGKLILSVMLTGTIFCGSIVANANEKNTNVAIEAATITATDSVLNGTSTPEIENPATSTPLEDNDYTKWVIDKEPTCKEKGLRHRNKISTGEFLQEQMPKLSHDLTEWIVDKGATYEEEGHKYKKCKVCGETIIEEVIPKLVKEEKTSEDKIDVKDYQEVKDNQDVKVDIGEPSSEIKDNKTTETPKTDNVSKGDEITVSVDATKTPTKAEDNSGKTLDNKNVFVIFLASLVSLLSIASLKKKSN